MSDLSADKATDFTASFRRRYRQLHDKFSEPGRAASWVTPGQIVMADGPMCLRRFDHADDVQPGATLRDNMGTPVLIVYSHVNRPHVLDLAPERSLIHGLQQQGHKVFLLEWKAVENDDADNDLSLYVDRAIDVAVDWLTNEFETTAVNLVGICQGGTFCLCYASLYPDRVSRLVTMVTPVDFHAGNSLLARWVEQVDFETLSARPRNVPGAALTAMFQALRPFDDMLRHVRLVNEGGGEVETLEFAAKIDRWVHDCPDQPGRAFAQFAQQCFQRNALISNQMMIADRRVDLARLTMPILNVWASNDHLVPPASSLALGDAVNSDLYRELMFEGGHIGLLVSERAQQTVIPEIGEWLCDV